VSFSLQVFAAEIPSELPSIWARALETHGLVASIQPRLSLPGWHGGWLAWRLLVKPEVAPGRYYPEHSVAAGFELDVEPNEQGSDFAVTAPEDVRQVVAAARYVLHFSTSASRTAADLRLQCMAAATLAGITAGVLYDPQQGAFYSGEAAIKNAKREAEAYEADCDPAAWVFEPSV
jgi:hypothetical protein